MDMFDVSRTHKDPLKGRLIDDVFKAGIREIGVVNLVGCHDVYKLKRSRKGMEKG
jgi:hypothetical protein